MRYLNCLIFLLFVSCSSDSDPITIIEQEGPPPPNSAPSDFTVENITFDGNKVTIDWKDAVDTDKDQIFYKLYIENILIGEFTESIATLEDLKYNTSYNAKIIATDKKGATVETSFNFETLDSKILFFSQSNGSLTAFDLYTRKAIWIKPTSYIDSYTTFEDVIYSGLYGINGLNILTGDIVFTSTPNTNYDTEYRNIIVDENNIYAFDSDSNLHCVNRMTGLKLWERSFLDYYAPLSIDNENVFVCSSNNDHIYAINKLTGEINWSREVDPNSTSAAPRINTNPLILNNNIYYGDNIGRFYSVNKDSGEKNWSTNVGLFNSFNISPTVYNGDIIAGTTSQLYAFDAANGSIKWNYKPQGYFETSPFIYNERIYIGVSNNGSGELICLNANNGQLIWKFDLQNNTTSSPIVYEGVVYIADWNKNLYAVKAETGILEWKMVTDEIIIKSFTLVVGNSKEVIYPSVHGLKN